MLKPETVAWLRENCPCGLTGKTVLITGASSGIGLKTAETMLWLGAKVIMACRNIPKAEAVRNELLRDYPAADIRVMRLDLSDFRSIDSFVNGLTDVDVFVNNAGLLRQPGEKTAQGFDMVMGTNYLGTYYLTETALPKLKRLPHDVIYINTVSIIHRLAHVSYPRFHDSRGAYARSKLCLARYTGALARRCAGTNVHVYMNHPGMAVTPIAAHIIAPLYRFAKYAPINSAEKSSLSVAWILSHNVPEGAVVGPCRGFGGWGYPGINRPCRRAGVGADELIRFTEGEIMRVTGGNGGPAVDTLTRDC